jgi:outer membrane protein assembly factor BamB
MRYVVAGRARTVTARFGAGRKLGVGRKFSAGLLAAGLAGTLALAQGTAAAAAAKTASVTVSPNSEWLGYLGGPLHTSYRAAQTAITPANATSLVSQWTFSAGAPFTASPTVTNAAVFIGGADGVFYKLSESTGAVLREVNLGAQPALSCKSPAGIAATATVGSDPRSHAQTVYVAGGDGYLYALRGSNLSVRWRALIGMPSRSINNYYDWSSPTVSHGRIYIGISSKCDKPLVRGGVLEFSQATGKKLGEYFTVPKGTQNLGGSVWSSIGIAPDGDVYATTGNGPRAMPHLQSSEAILKLSPSLKLLGIFHVPKSQVTNDGDFGSSPVFFGGDVGACNKNGVFYALQQSTMKLAWWKRVASADGANGQCLAAPASNGQDLFMGGGATTIGGTAYAGSMQERSPATGAMVTETGLPAGVLGSPTLDGGGLLTVGTYAAAPAGGVYLINAATGSIVTELTTGETFAQSVFANNRLYTATDSALTVWALPPAG